MDRVALLFHHDMDAHRLVQIDAVVVDEALGLEAAVDPFGDGASHLHFGKLEQPLEAGERIRLAELGDQLAHALLAEPARADLAADVAEHELRRAAVGGDDLLDLDAALAAAVIAHGGKMQAFVEGLARLARARAGHGAADIALVRDRAAEADQLALDEDRRDHRHVGRVRTAALVGVIDQIGVAVFDVAAIGLDHRAAAGGERAHVQRQHDMLRDHVAARVHDGAGGILGFAHDGREAGAEQRVLHLLHDAGERRLHDLDVDRAELRLSVRRHHAAPR